MGEDDREQEPTNTNAVTYSSLLALAFLTTASCTQTKLPPYQPQENLDAQYKAVIAEIKTVPAGTRITDAPLPAGQKIVLAGGATSDFTAMDHSFAQQASNPYGTPASPAFRRGAAQLLDHDILPRTEHADLFVNQSMATVSGSPTWGHLPVVDQTTMPPELRVIPPPVKVADKITKAVAQKSARVRVDAPKCMEKANLEKLLNDALIVQDVTGFPYMTSLTIAYLESSMGINPDAGQNVYGNDLLPFADQLRTAGPQTRDAFAAYEAPILSGGKDIREKGTAKVRGKKGKGVRIVSTPSRLDTLDHAVKLMVRTKGVPQTTAQLDTVKAIKKDNLLALGISATHIQTYTQTIYELIKDHNPAIADLIKEGIPLTIQNIGAGGTQKMAENLQSKVNTKYVLPSKLAIFKIDTKDTNLDALMKMSLFFIETQKIIGSTLAEKGLTPEPSRQPLKVAQAEQHLRR